MALALRDVLGPGGRLSTVMPGFEFRPQQLAMAEDFRGFLDTGGVFLAEAGTGTGKSLAYLLPPILSGRRLIVSTGTKNLQSQLVNKDLPLAETITGRSLKVVLMKGRSNYLCLRKWDALLREPAWGGDAERREFRLIARWADTTRTGDRSEIDGLPDASSVWRLAAAASETCLGKNCPFHDRCFVIRLKIRAQSADILVVNHHLFFSDMALMLQNKMRILPPADAVVFDEAHLLETIMMDILGINVSLNTVNDLVSAVRQWRPKKKGRKADKWPLKETIAAVQEAAVIFFESFGKGEGRFALEDKLDGEIERRMDKLADRIETLQAGVRAENRIPGDVQEDIAKRLETFAGDLRFIIRMDDPDYVFWGEHLLRGAGLHANPVDVSGLFPEIIRKLEAPVLLTSATLQDNNNFSYVSRQLGLNGALSEIYDSPFEYSTQGILYIPEHLPEPKAADFFDRVADEIAELLDLTRGRALILCTSVAGMRAIGAAIADRIPFHLLTQGEASREHLLRRFKEDVSSVLLATMSFWQGVDVPGEALSAVIIDRIPFEAPGDPVVKARIAYYERLGMNAFMEYQVPRAAIVLKQGVGRLIRSMSDRGLIAILDKRLMTKHYGKRILRNLPAFRRISNRDDVRLFFEHS